MKTNGETKIACLHEYATIEEFRDPDSGHLYLTYRCSKCGDKYGRWEDAPIPQHPPQFGSYHPTGEEIFNEESFDLARTPILVTDITKEIKKYLAAHPENLYALHPRQFERLIADILTDFGLEANLTRATRDGGYDIYAYVKNITTLLLFVECKRWSPERKVGIEIVQRMHGAAKARGANKSMIVTTSFFTLPARREQQLVSSELDLKDYNDLKIWLQRYR